MAIAKMLVWSVWLLLLSGLTTLGAENPHRVTSLCLGTSMANSVFVMAYYDEHAQATVGCDRGLPITFAYDSTATPPAGRNLSRMDGASAFFEKFAEIVAAETAPSLIGNTSPTQSILKAVYNADTGEIAVQFPLAEGTHAEVAVNAGWGESPNLIGGYLKFSGGKITAGDWVDASGLLPGNPGLVTKAQAATQTLMSGH